MKTGNAWEISHHDIVKLITPSFSAVDEVEDMDAIMARTRFIVITDNGIYYRVEATAKTSMNFIPLGELAQGSTWTVPSGNFQGLQAQPTWASASSFRP